MPLDIRVQKNDDKQLNNFIINEEPIEYLEDTFKKNKKFAILKVRNLPKIEKI